MPNDAKKWANEHEQLAEWLEVLKFLRQWKSDVTESLCKYDCNSVEEVAHNAYNRAIDDFKEYLLKHKKTVREIETKYIYEAVKLEFISDANIDDLK